MDDEQDKRCHALINDLREFRKSSKQKLSNAVHAAHAQAESPQETLAPPADAPRYSPHYSSTLYIENETTHDMHDPLFHHPANNDNAQENVSINQKTYTVLKPKKVQNLDKTIESLWDAHANQKQNTPINFSIDRILNTEQKNTHPQQSFTLPQCQNEKNYSQTSSRASSHSFEVLQYPPDSRTPLSMKKAAASNAAKSRHLEINDTHDNHEQNGKNFENKISCKYSLSPYDQEGINLEELIKFKKQQMTLDIEPLTISTPFYKVHEGKNSDLRNTFLGQKQYSNLEKYENEQIKNLETSSLQKNSESRISKNSKTDNLEKITNHDNSKNIEDKEGNNGHEANYKIRSSDHDKSETKNKEIQGQDITSNHPTLYSILNEETIYNDRQDKPWNNKEVVNKRNMIYNTMYNAPISFSPCYTDGSGGILHGAITPEETKQYNPVDNREKMYMKGENNIDKPKDITFYGNGPKTALSRPQKADAMKDMARFYSFREGQQPYTCLFTSFAPAVMADQPTYPSANAWRLGANAAAAQAILTRIARRPPSKREYRKQRRHSRQFLEGPGVPDLIKPWRPKIKRPQPIMAKRDKMTNDSWHPMMFEYDLDTMETTHPTTPVEDLDNFTMDDYDNETRNDVDKEIDRLQDFNDRVLWLHGYKLIPYQTIQENLPPDLYIGSFMVQLAKHLCMFLCKPCDMAGFLKSNFKDHHSSAKHQNNAQIWIQQHYFLPMARSTIQDQEINKETTWSSTIQNQEINKETTWSKPNMFQQYSNLKEKIKAQSFPTKYTHEVLGLVTEFYESKDVLEVKFTKEFQETRDNEGQIHWILWGFNYLKSKEDPRQYLKEKFMTNDLEFVAKNPVQLSEVKYISDLARYLFLLFINADFIPIDYIAMLATVMNTQQVHRYPESSTGLFNGHQLDLLLNFGAMQLTYKDDINSSSRGQQDLSNMLLETNLSTEDNIHKTQESPNDLPGVNTMSNQEIGQQKAFQTPKFDTQECIAGIKGTTDEDLILHGPLTADLQIRKLIPEAPNIEQEILEKEAAMDYDSDWQARSKDTDPLWTGHTVEVDEGDGKSTITSSTHSIPSLESTFHYDQNNQAVHSPRPSTSSAGKSESLAQSRDSLISRRSHPSKESPNSHYIKSAIYISNLMKGLKKHDIAKMCKEFGTIKKIIKKNDAETSAAVLFKYKNDAKKAIQKLDGELLSTYYVDGTNQIKKETRLEVQYALRKGLVSYETPAIKKTNRHKLLIMEDQKSKTKKLPPGLPKITSGQKNGLTNEGLEEFNNSSFLVTAMEDTVVPKYSNENLKVKLFSKTCPDRTIRHAMMSMTCGLAPRIQIHDGPYVIINSTTIVNIRNSSKHTLNIRKQQLLKGVQAHTQEYVSLKTEDQHVGIAAYHLQCKTFKLMNQFQDNIDKLSNKKQTNNPKVLDCNPWEMQNDPE